ncbi:MAG: GNAT family N-acetyltransferase [Pseudomonadota bacterium]
MSIRRAALADADALTDLYLSSRRELVADAPLVHSESQVRQWVREVLIPNATVAVLEVGVEDPTCVGFIALSSTADSAWIDQLYIDPMAVRRGHGRALVRWAKALVGPPIRLYTFQFNDPARRFYTQEDFVVVEYRDGSQNEERCPDVLYEWRG